MLLLLLVLLPLVLLPLIVLAAGDAGCITAISVNHWVNHVHRDAIADDEATVEEIVDEARQSVSGGAASGSSMGGTPRGGGGDGRPRRATWMDAGTTDLEGHRQALANTTERLCNHAFDFGLDRSGHRLRVGFGAVGQLLVSGLLVGGLVVTLAGAYMMGVEFDVEGLAGVLLELGASDASHVEISLLSSAQLMLSYGLPFLALVYALVAFGVPLVQIVSLSILWLCPLTLKAQKLLFFVNESLSGWSGLEVFLVATVVSLLEIGQGDAHRDPCCEFLESYLLLILKSSLIVSGFMIGSACDPLRPYFETATAYGLLSPAQAHKDPCCEFLQQSLLFILK